MTSNALQSLHQTHIRVAESAVEQLAAFIRAGITTKGSRNVFDSRLDEAFPWHGADRSAQMEQVRRFAEANGWSVRFLQNGRMVTFRSSLKPCDTTKP